MLVDHCHVRASVCSNSGKPDGYVIFGDISTWASAGEVISFEAHLFGSLAGGVKTGVAAVCNPR